MTAATRDRIPPHLRQHVVEQDYEAYDEIDQAVWRFVLLQTYVRLRETAHPAYTEGLAQTGIDVERIPRIQEMDDRLSAYGWGAVVVDGFLPPRAFQEFQALRIMTIAAAIRTSEHLAYTPAPDIIHESAGHSPIVPDPEYREYLRRFGEVGAKAFSLPEDRRVYEAIRHLSEIKEDTASRAEDIAAAERELERAQAAVTELSEASLLSRLHWWTVEYGLVGTPDDYKLYGAGLLSSLGESHFCHAPTVAKIPLDAACIEVGYDITKPQPQLFVARDFAQLNEVLDEVADGLAQRRGGSAGLRTALASEEVGTVVLDTGLAVTGIVDALRGEGDPPAYLRFRGPCAIAVGGRILPGQGRERHPEGFGMPLGRLGDGRCVSALRPEELREGEAVTLSYATGVRVDGRLESVLRSPEGRPLLLTLVDATVVRGDERLFEPEWGPYDLAVGAAVTAVHAGPADPAYWPESRFPGKRVPRAKARPGAMAKLSVLYRTARTAWTRREERDPRPVLAEVAAELRRHFPDEWLLRWNLLESLRKLGEVGEPVERLREELLEIEGRFPDTAPVSTGLRYLDEVYSREQGTETR